MRRAEFEVWCDGVPASGFEGARDVALAQAKRDAGSWAKDADIEVEIFEVHKILISIPWGKEHP